MTKHVFGVAVVWALLGLAPGLAAAQLDPELGLEAGGGAETTSGGGAEVSVTEGEEDPEDARRSRDDEEPPEDGEEPEEGAAASNESKVEAFRLGLGVQLFKFESMTHSVDVGDDTAEQDTTGLAFGFAPSTVGLNFGVGFAERFVVGARFQLAVGTGSRVAFNGDESDGSSLDLGFLPYLELAFNPRAKTAVVMAYATAGVSSTALELGGVDRDQTLFVMGAGLGTHIFFTEGASIDPTLEFTYSLGGGNESGTDFDFNGLVLALELGMSLWL